MCLLVYFPFCNSYGYSTYSVCKRWVPLSPQASISTQLAAHRCTRPVHPVLSRASAS